MSDQGRPFTGTITPIGRGRYRIVEGRGSRVAFAASERGRVWVFVEGRVVVVGPAADAGHPGSAHQQDEAALSAPMPATVLAVNVQPGDQVARGDVMILLEAMKMELAIRAPRDLVIGAVRCAVGELVQPGTPLVEVT